MKIISFFMKKSTFIKRLLSAIMVMVLVSNSGLIPDKIFASSKSREVLDSESGGSESKSVNIDNQTKDDSENEEWVLDCKLTVHQHSEDCYDEDNNIICGYADFVVHTHDKNCYDNSGKLVCTLPEIEEHTHSEECYVGVEGSTEIEGTEIENNEMESLEVPTEEIGGDMVIIMEEPIPLEEEKGDGRELSCQKPEVELHTHMMLCLDEDMTLKCGKLQVESHQHTQACYRKIYTSTKKIGTVSTARSTVKQNSISIEQDAQITENPKTETENLFWAFCIIGSVIMILAGGAIVRHFIYRKNGEHKSFFIRKGTYK